MLWHLFLGIIAFIALALTLRYFMEILMIVLSACFLLLAWNAMIELGSVIDKHLFKGKHKEIKVESESKFRVIKTGK